MGIGKFIVSLFTVEPAAAAENAEGPIIAAAEKHPEPPAVTCWFCRAAITDLRRAAAPGGQPHWRICASCVSEAAVELFLRGTLTVDAIVTDGRAAIAARTKDAHDATADELLALTTAEQRLRSDLARLSAAG